MRHRLLSTLCAIVVLWGSAEAVEVHNRFRTFTRELLKSEYLNDWQDDTAAKINELVAFHPADTTKSGTATHDTLAANGDAQITTMDPLVSLSASDSLVFHRANIDRAHIDTLFVGPVPATAPSWGVGVTAGYQSHFSYADTDTLNADSLTVGGPAVFDGAVNLNSTFSIGTTAVTATATELNLIDGVTATTAELNILDGVTSNATEINLLDGVTALGDASVGTENTWTADQTFNDNVKVTLGTGGDADMYHDGTNVVLNPKVIGSGIFSVSGEAKVSTASSGGSAHPNVNEFIVEGSGASGIQILSGNGAGGSIFFGDDGSNTQGQITYDHGSDGMLFATASTSRMTISNAGVVNIAQLTASSDLQTDGSKNLISTSDSTKKVSAGFMADGTYKKLLQLTPRYYKWKSDIAAGIVDPVQLGFYAQEVHLLIPEAAPRFIESDTTYSEIDSTMSVVVDTTWGFNSSALTAALVKSLQESHVLFAVELAERDSTIAAMSARIDSLAALH